MEDRVATTAGLTETGIPYRWEHGYVLVVPGTGEERVDGLLDGVSLVEVPNGLEVLAAKVERRSRAVPPPRRPREADSGERSPAKPAPGPVELAPEPAEEAAEGTPEDMAEAAPGRRRRGNAKLQAIADQQASVIADVEARVTALERDPPSRRRRGGPRWARGWVRA